MTVILFTKFFWRVNSLQKERGINVKLSYYRAGFDMKHFVIFCL